MLPLPSKSNFKVEFKPELPPMAFCIPSVILVISSASLISCPFALRRKLAGDSYRRGRRPSKRAPIAAGVIAVQLLGGTWALANAQGGRVPYSNPPSRYVKFPF